MSDSVSQFESLAKQLITEAWEYGAKGVYDEQTDFNIRRVRIANNTLAAALQQAQVPRPMVTPGGGA